MPKVTTSFGGTTVTHFKPHEIGWCEGEWKDIDPILGSMRDIDVHERFKKYSASTIGARRRKFDIPAFNSNKTPQALEKKRELEARTRAAKRYREAHPGGEISVLLGQWQYWTPKQRQAHDKGLRMKALLHCENVK